MQYQPPFGNSSSAPPPASKGIPSWVWIIGLSVGGFFLLVIAACGGVVAWVMHVPQPGAAAKEPFEVKSVAIPAFPERGPAQELEENVVRHEIQLGQQGGFYPTPGHGGRLWLYLPKGDHPPKSLPCVLITGAGSNMLMGMSLGEWDEDEHVPYARAGCAVVAYEMDGPELDYDDEQEGSIARSYQAFRSSRAGLVNARNALEFVLARVPEVDPGRIYSAGHSSAGTTSLLFAAHEPRLAGAVAYAPCCDVAKHLTPLGMRAMSMVLPGAADFAAQSSPVTHTHRVKCPVFLFHAEGDDVCDIADSRAFESALKQQGTNVTLETVAMGDHYESMIETGIPKAIEWLRRQAALRGASPAAPPETVDPPGP